MKPIIQQFNFKPLVSFNRRSPLAVAQTLRPIIEGKVICDLGCGEGDLLIAFQECGASETIGVEMNVERANRGLERKLNIIIENFMDIPLPVADIYYIWIENAYLPHIIEKASGKTLVIGDYGIYKDLDKIISDMNPIAIDIIHYETQDSIHDCSQPRSFRMNIIKN